MFMLIFLAYFLTSFPSILPGNQPQVDTKYTVYFFLLDECKICREYGPELKKYSEKYQSHDIDFVGVFPNFSSKKEQIQKYKSEFDLQFELKTDYFKKLSKRFGAKVLPEVFIYDHTLDTVIYSGRIDDRYVSIGQRQRVIKNYDLEKVLDSIVDNKELHVTRTEAIGCFINYNDNL